MTIRLLQRTALFDLRIGSGTEVDSRHWVVGPRGQPFTIKIVSVMRLRPGLLLMLYFGGGIPSGLIVVRGRGDRAHVADGPTAGLRQLSKVGVLRREGFFGLFCWTGLHVRLTD